MRSSPHRKKALRRTGLAVLERVALLGNSPPAWGHGSIAGGGTTVHSCMRALSPRIVRIVTPGQACSSFEQGLDLPHNGTLIGVVLAPQSSPPWLHVADVISPPIRIASCPPDVAVPPNSGPFRAVGITFTHTSDLSLAVSLPIGPNTWQVAFISPAGGPRTVTVQAVCVQEFLQS